MNEAILDVRASDFKFHISDIDELIDSYREFMGESEVVDFRIKNLRIDVFESTAIASYTFCVKYPMETSNYDESGLKIFVLKRYSDYTKIVWRNQQSDLKV